MEQTIQPFWLSPAFWIAVVIAVAVIAVIALLRGNLSGLRIKSGKLDAELKTREPRTLEISGIKQSGEKNVVETERDDTNIKNVEQKGAGQRVSAKKQ